MKKINLTKASIGREEIAAATGVLKSGWLIRGPQTAAFETEFAKFMGAKHAIATNGCTMALYLVVKHIGLQPTDEVIVPSLTWSATASIVIQAGATPVFADVDPVTWCLDPADVRRKLTPRTKLVIPVHYAGRFAAGFENFPVPVLYDSAHRVARKDFRGTTSCYSFYAVKNMTTVRGGMILTDDDAAAAWYRKAVHGGLGKDTMSRYAGQQNRADASSFYYEVEFPGWNFDMTDVEAAIGRVQLKKLPLLNRKRDALVRRYNRAFGLRNTGNHLYPILVEERDAFLVALRDAGIHCGVHYLPLHLMKGYTAYRRNVLPVTEYIGARCVSVPLFADMTERELKRVIALVREHAAMSKPPAAY